MSTHTRGIGGLLFAACLLAVVAVMQVGCGPATAPRPSDDDDAWFRNPANPCSPLSPLNPANPASPFFQR